MKQAPTGKSDYPMTWEQAVCWLREQPDQQELVRACFYDDPLSESAERYWNSSEWRAVRVELPSAPGEALDLGAGRGVASYALARDGWSVTALEPDPSDIVGCGALRALASVTWLPISIVMEWGERLPFDDAMFDVVHCRQVLHHAHDLDQMLREIGRVLKPGGTVIATREHVLSRHDDLEAFRKAHPLHRHYGGENAFLLAEYVKAIEGGGIVLDKVLNPYQSEINIFPRTSGDIKKILARRVRFPWPALIPDKLVSWIGSRSNAPGRPYSFVGRKSPDAAE
jgi:SAM-dependent methyltransferase